MNVRTNVGVPTIGQCKGTLEAVKAAGMVVIFHVPLFSSWLKEVRAGGTRVFPGNFLFSTGPSSEGGGKRRTRGYHDVPMRDCTVIIDNEVIIEKGRFLDEKMRVKRVQR